MHMYLFLYYYLLGLCPNCAVVYSQYCKQLHQAMMQQQQPKPDDTDSFTPRVRSDKRSIIMLLGKLNSAYTYYRYKLSEINHCINCIYG